MNRLPACSIATYTIGVTTDTFLTMTLRRPIGSDEAATSIEWSLDLSPASWATTGALVSRVDNGDGSQTEIWRAPFPVSAGRLFGRVKVTIP